MTNVWFTSDLHIGHGLVARERTRGMVLPRYVGAEIDAHDRILAQRWDAAVQRDDTVWVLGDVTVGGTEAVAYGLNWIANRPGVKHLVPGNHDPVHPMHRDAHRWQSAYLKVFASVQSFARRRIAGRSVLLSHFPYVGDHTEESRFEQYRLRDYGEWLLHGHTHSVAQYAAWRHPRQVHIGVDSWGLAPANLEDIARIITQEL